MEKRVHLITVNVADHNENKIKRLTYKAYTYFISEGFITFSIKSEAEETNIELVYPSHTVEYIESISERTFEKRVESTKSKLEG